MFQHHVTPHYDPPAQRSFDLQMYRLSQLLCLNMPLGDRQPQAGSPPASLGRCLLIAPDGMHAAVPQPLAEPEPEPLAISFPGGCYPCSAAAAAARNGLSACLLACLLGSLDRWLTMWQPHPSLLGSQAPLHHAPALCAAVPQPLA
jgi:hypothetical protein